MRAIRVISDIIEAEREAAALATRPPSHRCGRAMLFVEGEGLREHVVREGSTSHGSGRPDIAPGPSRSDRRAARPVRARFFDLLPRIGADAVLLGLLAGALWRPASAMGLVIALGLVAESEFFRTVRRLGLAPAAVLGTAAGGGVMVAGYVAGPAGTGAALAASAVAAGVVCAASRRRVADWAATLLVLAWVPGTLSLLGPIARAPRFRILIAAVVAITGTLDAVQYLVGRAVGRTPLAPRISPGKTVEGLAGGIVAALLAGALFGFLDPLTVQHALLLAVAACVAGPAGDLLQSRVKRAAGIKDMGTLLPGQGGLMDLMDSFVFVVPVAYLLFLWWGYLD
jgi:phosphatidate cytidylyltransferase